MKISKAVVDSILRNEVFHFMFPDYFDDEEYSDIADSVIRFEKINDRQFGILMKDVNGAERYIRIGAIVAELREDMSAEELMESEIADYNAKKAKKAEQAAARAEKAAKDKAKREAAKKEKEGE